MEILKGIMENQWDALCATAMVTSTSVFLEVVTKPVVTVFSVLIILQAIIVSGVLLGSMEMLLIHRIAQVSFYSLLQLSRCVCVAAFDFAIGCDCHISGTQNGSICNNITGQCICLPNVEGQRCNTCTPDHYGLNAINGCTACNCDAVGSWSSQCDSITGQCSCKPGVTGHRCNMCMENYYNFSTNGCQGTLYIYHISKFMCDCFLTLV